jgi:hypothetical protein
LTPAPLREMASERPDRSEARRVVALSRSEMRSRVEEYLVEGFVMPGDEPAE